MAMRGACMHTYCTRTQATHRPARALQERSRARRAGVVDCRHQALCERLQRETSHWTAGRVVGSPPGSPETITDAHGSYYYDSLCGQS